MNSNAEYTLDEIKLMLEDYIQHRADGYSKHSFAPCDYRTLERHLEVYAVDLQTEKRKLEEAERTGRWLWEKIGKTMAKEGIGNATAWIFNMKNRYPEEWADKQHLEHSGNAEAPVIFQLDPRFGKENN